MQARHLRRFAFLLGSLSEVKGLAAYEQETVSRPTSVLSSPLSSVAIWGGDRGCFAFLMQRDSFQGVEHLERALSVCGSSGL